MRIRFIKGHKVQQHDGNGAEYLQGSVHDFSGFVSETYGRKYIRLGLAVEEPAGAAETQPAAVAPEVSGSSPALPAATYIVGEQGPEIFAPTVTEESPTDGPPARQERRGRSRPPRR